MPTSKKSTSVDYLQEYLARRVCFENIPSKALTQEICDYAFFQNREHLSKIPKKFHTQKMIDRLIERMDGCHLDYIAPKLLTEKNLLELIDVHPNRICDIPKDKRNDSFYLKALENTQEIMIHIKDPSDTLCLAAYEINKRTYKALPDHLKTYERSLETIKIHPDLYEHLPEDFQLDDQIMKLMQRAVFIIFSRGVHSPFRHI